MSATVEHGYDELIIMNWRLQQSDFYYYVVYNMLTDIPNYAYNKTESTFPGA